MDDSIISAVLEAEKQAELVVAAAKEEGTKLRRVAAEEADVLESRATQQVAQRLSQTKESLAAEAALSARALEEKKTEAAKTIRREAEPKRAAAVEAVLDYWR